MKTIFTALLFTFSLNGFPQYTFYVPKVSFAIEVSLENTSLMRLPMYRNSISSLIVLGDNIIAGTTADKGLTPFIFSASISKRDMIEIFDLNKVIPGQRAIRTGFTKGKNGTLYAGTIANKTASGRQQSGHLIEVRMASGKINVTDMGTPIDGESIFALTSAADGSMMYGITYPTGIFFSYNIATGAVKKFNETVPSPKDISTLNEYVLKPDDYLCKALIETAQGQIIGSFPVNKLFSFNPSSEKFEVYEQPLPEVWGRRVLGQVECWMKTKRGTIYGGNAGDGQLFELDPVAKKMKNLGKPVMMPRLRGLALGNDGRLYGIAGASPGYVHLFSYSEKTGFVDYGNPSFVMKAPGIEQGIEWRAFQLGTIAASEDGKYIVMGEDEALSQLLIFAPEGK
jgi:hypothetical protein